MTEHNFMTVKQVADELGLHRNTVLKLIDDGRLDAIRVGSRYLITRDALDELVVIRETDESKPSIFRKPKEEPPKKKEKRKPRGKAA